MRYSPIWVFQFNQHVHTRLLSRPFLLKIVHERKYLCRFMRAIREGQVKRIQALISLDRGPGSSGWVRNGAFHIETCGFSLGPQLGEARKLRTLTLDDKNVQGTYPKLRGLFTEFILTSSSNVSSFLAPRGPASTYCNNWRDTRSKCRSRHGQLMGGVVRVRESQVRLAMDIIITDNLWLSTSDTLVHVAQRVWYCVRKERSETQTCTQPKHHSILVFAHLCWWPIMFGSPGLLRARILKSVV